MFAIAIIIWSHPVSFAYHRQVLYFILALALLCLCLSLYILYLLFSLFLTSLASDTFPTISFLLFPFLFLILFLTRRAEKRLAVVYFPTEKMRRPFEKRMKKDDNVSTFKDSPLFYYKLLLYPFLFLSPFTYLHSHFSQSSNI